MIAPPPPPVVPCVARPHAAKPSAVRSEAGLAVVAWEARIARHAAGRRYRPQDRDGATGERPEGCDPEDCDPDGCDVVEEDLVVPPPKRRITFRARVRVRPSTPPLTGEPPVEF